MKKISLVGLRKDGTIWLMIFYLLLGAIMVSHSFYQIKQKELTVLTRGLYDENSLVFTIKDYDQTIDWRLLNTTQSFSVFNEVGTIKDKTKENKLIQYDIRAMYYQKDTYFPPMIVGRFFRESDFYCEKKLAVIGKNVDENKENYVLKNGKEYYVLGDEMFEIIGKMGAPYSSKIDNMVLLNLDAIKHVPSNVYVMNIGSNLVMNDRSLKFKNITLSIDVQDREDSGVQRSFAKDVYEIMISLIAILVTFSFSFLFSIYWMDKKNFEVQTLWRLGIRIQQVYKRYAFTHFIITCLCYLIVCCISYLFVLHYQSIPDAWMMHSMNLLKGFGVIFLSSTFSVWVSFKKSIKQIT